MDIRSSLDGLKSILGVNPSPQPTTASTRAATAQPTSIGADSATVSSAGSEVLQSAGRRALGEGCGHTGGSCGWKLQRAHIRGGVQSSGCDARRRQVAREHVGSTRQAAIAAPTAGRG